MAVGTDNEQHLEANGLMESAGEGEGGDGFAASRGHLQGSPATRGEPVGDRLFLIGA